MRDTSVPATAGHPLSLTKITWLILQYTLLTHLRDVGGILHIVVETPAYLRDTQAVGMIEAVRSSVVDPVSASPALGDEFGVLAEQD